MHIVCTKIVLFLKYHAWLHNAFIAKLKFLRASDEETLQGVWETTRLGRLKVVGCNVTYDSMKSKSFLLKRTHDDRIALGDCRTRISPSDKPVQLHWKRAHPTSSQSDAIILAKCAHDRTSRVQQSDAHLDQHPQKRKKREEIVAVRSSSFVESQLYMLAHAQYTIQANSD